MKYRHGKSMAVLALLTLSGVTFCGCTPSETIGTPRPSEGTDSATPRLRVSCTSNIVKDLVRQIGGDHVEVTAIMDGPAVDPHLYTPSPQDINTLTESDVVVYSGLHLEAQFEGALESLANRGIPAIRVTEILERDFGDRLLNAEGAVDPHVWFDPELWSSCGDWLASELAGIDAEHAEDYQANAGEFRSLMSSTIERGQAALQSVPAERRILVTAHDAFQYFARAFEFEVKAVQGLSTESEPGLRQINELASLLVETKISAIFTEQSVSDRNIQALISECAARGHQLTVGGTLYSDTAGAEGSPEETLAGALLHNIDEIVRGLAPETSSQEAL